MIGSESRNQIQAVLYIQWLSLRNSLRRRSERLGLVFSTIATIFWYGFWSAGAIGLFAFAFLGSQERLQRALPEILFFILMYWQLSPVLTASMGVSIDLRKMALYPVQVKTLFWIECLLRLLTGLEMVLLLGGLSLGTVVRRPQRVVAIVPALVFFLAFNVFLSAGLRNLLERLLQRRGMREAFLFLVVMASALPQLLLWSGTAHRVGERIYQAFRFLPQSVLPSSALARSYLGANHAGDWPVLAGWCLVGAAFGWFQFRRSFYYDFAAARSARLLREEAGQSWVDGLYRLPGKLLPDPIGALVEKELRYLMRSPRFRFLFLMGCSFGVVAWLPFAMRHSESPEGMLQASFLTLLSLYALLLLGQLTFLNSLGLDRSAARYFFWMPVPATRILLAKNIVAALFVVLQVLVLAAICLLLRMGVGGWQLLEALAVTSISALYLSSVGNLTSVTFASGLSPERVSRGGAGRGIQGLIVFLYPLLISPVLAAYVVRYYWESMRLFVLMLGVAALLGLTIYSLTLPFAARLGYRRRERLLEELSRGEGPLVSE